MKSSIQIAIVAIIAIVLGFAGLVYGLERQERYECAKWESQAKELKGFYLTDWQKSQCSQYDQN
jgi:hypothetical protein